MKILILAAMQKEIDLLLNILESYQKKQLNGIEINEGIIGKHQVFIGKCGIGKVNSAINTYRLINCIHPDLLINSGVAGGAGLPVGSLLIPNKVAYHDVWCGPGSEYGQADGLPLFMQCATEILDLLNYLPDSTGYTTGLLCSGDKFISSRQEIDYIKTKFPDVKAVDMESASIAQVCAMTNTSFAIIRIVSDTPGEAENTSQYQDFWEKAPEKTFQVLRLIINAIK